MRKALTAPVGYCPSKGCPNRSNGFCPEHQKTHNQLSAIMRRPSHRLLHTNRWKQTSKRNLAKQPWCVGYPADVHQYAPILAECTDHKIPVWERPDLCFDPENHQSLCHDYNRRKGIAEEGGFGRTPVQEKPL